MTNFLAERQKRKYQALMNIEIFWHTSFRCRWWKIWKMNQVYIFFSAILMILIVQCDGQTDNTENSPIINTKTYSSMFVRRRLEHRTLLDHFQRTEKYDRKYKLLEIGINQILSILSENKEKLLEESYSTSQGFPKTTTLIDAVSLIVENTCLIGDMILHMPDMSDIILSKDQNWKQILDWAIGFTVSLDDVIDPKTQKMLSLLDQEINVEKRTNDYINPYRNADPAIPNKRTKQKKKLKKGPQLHSATRTEL